MTRRRKQQNADIAPFVVLLVVALGFGVYNSQQSLILISSVTLGILLLVGVILLLMKKARDERLRRSGITQIDQMTGNQFEAYLRVLLSNSGYKKIRKPIPDLGVDLIATKDGITWAIQAKRYKGKVKLDAIRQVVSTLTHYQCDRAMVITNSYFTAQAKTIAASTNCALIDRDELIKLLLAQTE